MSKTRSERKEYYKLMEKSEKDMRKRIIKEMTRFKGKDSFELEDHIIDLEHQIKELNEQLRQARTKPENPYELKVDWSSGWKQPGPRVETRSRDDLIAVWPQEPDTGPPIQDALFRATGTARDYFTDAVLYGTSMSSGSAIQEATRQLTQEPWAREFVTSIPRPVDPPDTVGDDGIPF
jgi:hypothetical protein